MNIVCVICSDHLQPSDDVFHTPCGHIFHFACVSQWLQRSQTCPQCREKVTQSKIHRIYFNFSNNDTIVEDPSSLQASVDSLKFQVHLKEQEVKQSNNRNATLKKEASGLRAEVRKLESLVVDKDTAINAFKEQLRYFKELSMDAENAKKEVVRLKKKLDELRSVQMLMNAPGEEVDQMIRNTQDPGTLITYISVMKRELMTSIMKRKELRGAVKRLQQDLSAVSMERNFLSEEHTHRKLLEEELIVAEGRIKEKSDRIKELEEMIPLSKRSKNLSARKSDMAEVAEPEGNTGTDDAKKMGKNHAGSLNSDDEIEISPIPHRKRPAAAFSMDNDVVDLTLETGMVDGNEENSPYLQFKSSQGRHGVDIPKRKVKVTSGPSSFSILVKKPRLAQSGTTLQECHRAPDLAYDGFGGHSKTDKFPSPKKLSGEAKKSSRGPPRRPKLDDGNNRKLGDFVNK